MNPTETAAIFATVIASTERQIAELESFFSVTCIDAWPFVVVRKGMIDTALKSLGGNLYNFSAMGRDACQLSRRDAEGMAEYFTAQGTPCEIVGKYDWFGSQLEAARRNLASFKQHAMEAA